jgi:predicted ArsR family transcriptional regulator
MPRSEAKAIRISVLEQAKIQAQVLVPLVKAMQAELGEQRANAIVRQALGDAYRKLGEQWSRSRDTSDLGNSMAAAFDAFAAGGALDYEVVKQSPDAFELNVTGCRYAQFYKELGAPELGFLFVCSADFTMAEGIAPDIKLTRTQTIMQGAGHCDFRYARVEPKDGHLR